jgi:hypothetical protein
MTDISSQTPSTLFDDVYANVYKTIKKKSVDSGDIIRIVASAMVVVQKYPELDGATKKQLVIDVLSKIVDDSGLVKDEDKEACHLLIQVTVPVVIDTIVSAYNHEIDLKKVKSCFAKCFGCVAKTN